MQSILIDPGHGGKFPGATVYNTLRGEILEKDIVLKVASQLKISLERLGYEIFMTREADLEHAQTVRADLKYRTELERVIDPDCFVSIHCNAATDPEAHGIEVFTSKGVTRADDLATEILDSFDIEWPGEKIRKDFSDGDPDKEENFYVLKNTIAPAVLIELGFMTNNSDLFKLIDPGHQSDLAMVIAAGINAWMSKGR